MDWNDKNLIKVLAGDGVVVMPTDTLYGIVGKALNPTVVNRIYELRKRAPNKPCIILIGDIGELEKFSVTLSEEQKTAIEKYWSSDFSQNNSGPTSIVLTCSDETLTYLHRGTKTLAFRLPAQISLQNLLKETGPLIAPSANLEAKPPSKTISEAKEYFGTSVDLYVDAGEITGKASKIIKLHKDSSVSIIRQ